ISTTLPLLGALKVNTLTAGLALTIAGYSSQALGKHYDTTHQKTVQLAASHQQLNQHTRSMTETVSNFAQVAGTRAVIATIAYNSGLDEIIEASSRHLSLNSEYTKSVIGLTGAIGSLVNEGVNEFTAGTKASVVAVLTATTGFNDLTSAVDFSAHTLTSW